MSSSGLQRQSFPTTRWSAVTEAGIPISGRGALDRLLRQYMPALRMHLTYRLGPYAQDIDDILQGFITDKMVAGNLCGHAQQGLGKFRSFLLTSLDNYAMSYRRRPGSRERRGVPLESPDVAEQLPSAQVDGDPFDLVWARQVIMEAIEKTQSLYRVTGRPRVYELFDRRVLGPILRGEPAPSVEALAAEFGYATPQQASNAIANAKRTFTRMLRDVVSTYSPTADVEEELRDLKEILARCGAR